MASGSSAATSLQEQFAAFSKFGDTKSDGKSISLSQADKWFKQANVLDKKITTTDTGISFKKFKANKITFADFEKYIDDLAQSKKVDAQTIRNKLINCGAPGTTNTTTAVKTGGVERLTDTTKYTGTHKERFDESGQGKGLEGRVDSADTSGYVGGYKGKDTYDEKHQE